MTQKVYAELGHPKMHPHTKFGIPTSKNIEVMQILETRSEFKVTVTGKWNGTIRHSKSKERCKDQELIQSSTTPDPGYQWESDKLTEDTPNRAKRSALSQQVTTKHI